ncbi:MAG: RHS repeat-associated core domain-containing protein, partial [Pirellula sp.]
LYNADDRITSELLDKQNNGTTDQTTTYAWSGTRQSSKTVVIPSTSTVTQTFSYTLPGMLSQVVTENKNGSNVVTSRTRVDYDYTSTGIRSLSVDWNDANLNNSFATSERTGSVEYLVDSVNHTGYAQTIVETTKNAAGVAPKRIVYTYGSDEISQTTYLPPAGGGAGWNAGTTLTFSHDAHTSVRMLTDAAGAIAQAFTYAAYGELIGIHNRIAQSVGTVGAQGLQSQALTSLLYNGEAFDSRIGQLYLRARWYDGHRFTTLDPFAGNSRDPLSYNKYGFVHANPVMGIDPTGKFLGVSLGALGLLGGIAIGHGVQARYNRAVIASGGRAVSGFLGYLGMFGKVGFGFGGFLTGTGAALVVSSYPGVRALWLNTSVVPPKNEDNIRISDWIDNVEAVLVKHVEGRNDLTPQQRADGITSAHRIASSYVVAVHERAKKVFRIENASETMFGNGGWASGWQGNLADGIWGDESRDCDTWATHVKNNVSSSGGWKVLRVEDSLKAGDSMLGSVLKHNFVLLKFDPHAQGRDTEPAFVLDPWVRARPDIFDFAEFDRYWPIEGTFMYE